MDNVGMARPPAVPASLTAASGWRAKYIVVRRTIWSTPLRQALTLGVVALIPRLAFVLSVRREGLPLNDTFFYQTAASQLAQGNGYSDFGGAPTAKWPPVFPVVISLLYRVFGQSEIVGELFNVVLGSASVLLLYFIVYRTFGALEAALASAALALMPVHIFLADVLLSETLSVFTLLALFALLIVLPPARWASALVGIVIGVAALTRGEGLLLGIIPFAVWWPELPRRELLIRMAIVAMGAALLVGPWTVRNAVQLHAFVPISTNGGQTLYSGHNPRSNGGPTYPPPALLAQAKGKADPAREIEQEKLLRKTAIHWALRHPRDELLLIPKKLVALVGRDQDVFYNWVNTQPAGTHSAKRPIGHNAVARLGMAADFSWYALLASFIFALILLGWTVWDVRLLRGAIAWFAMCLVLYGFVLNGNFRYHVELQPLMMIFVAALVARVWQRRRLLRPPRLD